MNKLFGRKEYIDQLDQKVEFYKEAIDVEKIKYEKIIGGYRHLTTKLGVLSTVVGMFITAKITFDFWVIKGFKDCVWCNLAFSKGYIWFFLTIDVIFLLFFVVSGATSLASNKVLDPKLDEEGLKKLFDEVSSSYQRRYYYYKYWFEVFKKINKKNDDLLGGLHRLYSEKIDWFIFYIFFSMFLGFFFILY